MKTKSLTLVLFLVLTLSVIIEKDVFAGHRHVLDTDSNSMQTYSVFDLRERETYVQVTNTGNSNIVIHVQIFNVNDNCNENNFYDTLTPNDTHTYNLADIQTNNGNPSGVVLPAGAYGSVIITSVAGVGLPSVDDTILANEVLIGNFRILDVSGFEYRTNSAGWDPTTNTMCGVSPAVTDDIWTFNFNMNDGVILSDFFLISLANPGGGFVEVIADPLEAWISFDVDIYDLNEVPFSCRNVAVACINENSNRLEELLADVGDASVASFDYGINNVLPSSKGAPLLCPGNTVTDGLIRISEIFNADNEVEVTYGLIGLNNGNGRGSMDAMFSANCTISVIPPG